MSNPNAMIPPENSSIAHQQQIWRWKILFATYFAYAGFYLTRKAFTICKPQLAEQFKVDISMIAYIWTAYLIAYAVGQVLNSFLGRKFGPRILLLGGLGISILINFYFGFSNSYWTFMVFMVFNGLVQAAGWPGCVGGVAEWLPKSERGSVMGIWSTNYLMGNIFVKALGGYLLGTTVSVSLSIGALKLGLDAGWRFAFLGCTLAAFVIWWIVLIWQRDRPEDVGLPRIVDMDDCGDRSVEASNAEHITFKQYAVLLVNPVILMMGIGYFCLKFLRYAMDSWEPTFIQYLGLSGSHSAYLSMIFDLVGLPGAILAGIALDRWFKGKWAPLCLIMGVGMAAGYVAVVMFGANPYMFAICVGLVGFMLYGPDTLMCGAAAVEVAGERNAVAVAGLVNGLGSIGPILQEPIIGRLMKNEASAMRNANILGLGMSVVYVVIMLIITLQVSRAQKKCQAGRTQ